MATTWTIANITPGARNAGLPIAQDCAEGSSQNGTLGAPVVVTGGYLKEVATNGTAITGFAAVAMQNGATDGAKTGKYYKLAPRLEFVATFICASWDQSFVMSKVKLATTTGTVWVVVSATNVSSIADCRIEKALSDRIAAGDVNPPVIISVLNANVQGEV